MKYKVDIFLENEKGILFKYHEKNTIKKKKGVVMVTKLLIE